MRESTPSVVHARHVAAFHVILVAIMQFVPPAGKGHWALFVGPVLFDSIYRCLFNAGALLVIYMVYSNMHMFPMKAATSSQEPTGGLQLQGAGVLWSCFALLGFGAV